MSDKTLTATWKGERRTLTLREWSDLTGLSVPTIWGRLRRGWDPERTIRAGLVGRSEAGRRGKRATVNLDLRNRGAL